MAHSASNWSNYFQESSRPLASLFFVAPLLVAYEGGVMILGGSAIRNGVDVWLRTALDRIGFGQYFLLPLLTVAILLAWHHMRRETWQVDWGVCYGMLLESALFGWLLLILAQLQGALFDAQLAPAQMFGGPAGNVHAAARLIGYIGAGVYEELLFRLMLLPLVILMLRGVGVPFRWAAAVAILVTSTIFAAAHYQWDFHVAGMHLATPFGEPFDWYSFSFRAMAGGFFSVLFVCRGFGIAVGAHALYDVLVLAM